MIESIIAICLDAGREVMRIFHGNGVCLFRRKSDNSPITSADFIANYIIISALQKLTPGIPILSEEDFSFWRKDKVVDYFWVIDPLDGTKEFLSHNYEFTINIALVEGGRPTIGVIYAPAMGILYFGMNNTVWKIDVNTGYRKRISVKHLYPPVVVISRFHNDHRQLNNYLVHLVDYKLITVGSSLKFCLIAEGIAQMYPRFSFINVWDIAAGHAIAMAAGAVVNDWSGCSLNYKNIQSSFLFSGFHVFVS